MTTVSPTLSSARRVRGYRVAEPCVLGSAVGRAVWALVVAAVAAAAVGPEPDRAVLVSLAGLSSKTALRAGRRCWGT